MCGGDELFARHLRQDKTRQDKTRQEVREATQKDPVLKTFLEVTDEGRLARKSDVPEPIRLYFDIRDTQSRQDGIILKNPDSVH